ncbi:MAG: hypothetical protein JOZ69_22675, partial [Myxococcales bacterium]|nr:hypothetical protein [Myxococcales bacterium]
AAACCACISRTRGYPLYAREDAPPDPAMLARLGGYVRYVDSQDVSEHGTSFDLLPGCHIVGTPETWGSMGAMSGGVVAMTGRVTFALRMKAGHRYVVLVDVGTTSGPSGSVFVRAEEHAPTGEVTRVFAPAMTGEDIRRCQASDEESLVELQPDTAARPEDARAAAGAPPLPVAPPPASEPPLPLPPPASAPPWPAAPPAPSPAAPRPPPPAVDAEPSNAPPRPDCPSGDASPSAGAGPDAPCDAVPAPRSNPEPGGPPHW